jgi:hypothetical protein
MDKETIYFILFIFYFFFFHDRSFGGQQKRGTSTRLRMDRFDGIKAAMALAAELSRALSLLLNRRVFRSLFFHIILLNLKVSWQIVFHVKILLDLHNLTNVYCFLFQCR